MLELEGGCGVLPDEEVIESSVTSEDEYELLEIAEVPVTRTPCKIKEKKHRGQLGIGGECEVCAPHPLSPSETCSAPSRSPAVQLKVKSTWQLLYEKANVARDAAFAHNADIQSQLNCAHREIERLQRKLEEFTDLNAALEEIARQREFMSTVAKMLSRGPGR
ncbi:hypothetical protein BDZ97DRAFT_2081187 [Flammula alnicola]|nr:hypothetical protein BDZ97DRAFT_1769762 [Flammula alnicola]KAF8955063.1 hypothetical protein BDZ97DRAFT_2081187 [Flammula alnicola]